MLKDDYDILEKNIPLHSKRKRLVAEIDLLAEKNGIYDIYEVKCSHRILKAKRQLTKIKKIISKNRKVRNSYFFCGESKQLILM